MVWFDHKRSIDTGRGRDSHRSALELFGTVTRVSSGPILVDLTRGKLAMEKMEERKGRGKRGGEVEVEQLQDRTGLGRTHRQHSGQ